MRTGFLTLLLFVSGTALADASCPMDFHQVPGMEKMNDMKMTSNPTQGKACNIQLGDGTGKDGEKKSIFFQNGQPCILSDDGSGQTKPVCGQALTKEIDQNPDHVRTIESDFTQRTNQQMQQNAGSQPLQTSACLGYNQDENGRIALYIFPKDPQTGKPDKSHYVRILQSSSGKSDCEMQTYGGQQVGDVIQKYTVADANERQHASASCNGAISMLGDSSLNFNQAGVYPVVNDTLAKIDKNDQSGAANSTTLVTTSNGGGNTSQ